MSPAYDITPINNSKQHGIGLGDDGRYASIDNLLSQAKRFGLNKAQATKIIAEVESYTRQWPTHFKRFANISDIDIKRLESVIPSIS
jgi:serine/threonine-protein kinase HipA